MNKIIALVGMCGSGKSIVNDYFVKKGYKSVYFGEITLNELQKRGLEVNETNEKFVREDLRKIHGMAAFALLNVPKIQDGFKNGNVIVDGLYSWAEYKVLKEAFGETLIVVAVYAPPEIRYARLAGRPVRPISHEDAKKRDYAEIENIEKGGPIAMADYTLINTSDVDGLLNQVEAIL